MANIQDLERELRGFYNARCIGKTDGPLVSEYVYSVSKQARMSDISDIAARYFMLVAPAHGDGDIAVYVPRENPRRVNMSDLIMSPKFRNNSAEFPLVLGVDALGAPIIEKLKTMSHTLIGGMVGTGKTMLLKSIVSSVVDRYTPTECGLIIIDTKCADFADAHGIPHLMRPVATNVSDALDVLGYIEEVIDDRFAKLDIVGMKNITSYNKKAQKRMSNIVIVIDELADLMAASPEDAEMSIRRIAQLGPGVGVYIVAATGQIKPDVLTDVIRVNFPTRISFLTRDRDESCTILGEESAKYLLPHGDALLSVAGAAPRRIHTPYFNIKMRGRDDICIIG